MKFLNTIDGADKVKENADHRFVTDKEKENFNAAFNVANQAYGIASNLEMKINKLKAQIENKADVTYNMTDDPPDDANSYKEGHIWINGTSGHIWMACGDEIQGRMVFREITNDSNINTDGFMHYIGFMNDSKINSPSDCMEVHGYAVADNTCMPYKGYWHIWKYRFYPDSVPNGDVISLEKAIDVHDPNKKEYIRQCNTGTWGEWKKEGSI